MATISLNLPDKVYQQAARLAQLMNRDVSRLLAETIESALSPLGTFEADIAPVENLSDRKILAITALQMNKTQGKRLNKLLNRQQEEKLSPSEQNELAALMQVYHGLLIRKAQAVAEAARRGLLPPLQS
jgi:hypothetical protein